MTTPDDSDDVTPLPSLTDHDRIKRLEAMGRRFKRYIWAAALATGASLGTAASILLHRAEAQGAATQQQIDTEKRVQRVEDDIRLIWPMLHRTSDQQPEPSSPSSDIPVPPDKMSAIDPDSPLLRWLRGEPERRLVLFVNRPVVGQKDSP